MPVTTSSISPASGSSRNPQVTWSSPMPSRVASGICGIQSATFTSYARDSAGRPSSCQKATSERPSASVIVPTATAPAALRENARTPTTPLIAAPIPGNSGINQMYRITPYAVGLAGRAGLAGLAGRKGPLCLCDPPDLPGLPGLPRLPPHQIHLVDVHGLFVAIERENDPEADGGLGGGDRDHEDREHLSDRVLLLRGEGNQVDVHRVQDQLDRHEDDDDVAA